MQPPGPNVLLIFQLFDLQEDPCEMHDLSGDAAYAQVHVRLGNVPVKNLYGSGLN